MPRTINYYFSLVSPWAYLGHQRFMSIAQRHHATVNYKPVSLAEVFAATGGLPLAQRPAARQKYRWLGLQRWPEKHRLNFNLKPKHWPFNTAIGDRFVIAAVAAGHDPDAFLRAAFKGIWEGEL